MATTTLPGAARPCTFVTDSEELEFLAILRAMPPHRYEATVRMAHRANAGMPVADSMTIMFRDIGFSEAEIEAMRPQLEAIR